MEHLLSAIQALSCDSSKEESEQAMLYLRNLQTSEKSIPDIIEIIKITEDPRILVALLGTLGRIIEKRFRYLCEDDYLYIYNELIARIDAIPQKNDATFRLFIMCISRAFLFGSPFLFSFTGFLKQFQEEIQNVILLIFFQEWYNNRYETCFSCMNDDINVFNIRNEIIEYALETLYKTKLDEITIQVLYYLIKIKHTFDKFVGFFEKFPIDIKNDVITTYEISIFSIYSAHGNINMKLESKCLALRFGLDILHNVISMFNQNSVDSVCTYLLRLFEGIFNFDFVILTKCENSVETIISEFLLAVKIFILYIQDYYEINMFIPLAYSLFVFVNNLLEYACDETNIHFAFYALNFIIYLVDYEIDIKDICLILDRFFEKHYEILYLFFKETNKTDGVLKIITYRPNYIDKEEANKLINNITSISPNLIILIAQIGKYHKNLLWIALEKLSIIFKNYPYEVSKMLISICDICRDEILGNCKMFSFFEYLYNNSNDINSLFNIIISELFLIYNPLPHNEIYIEIQKHILEYFTKLLEILDNIDLLYAIQYFIEFFKSIPMFSCSIFFKQSIQRFYQDLISKIHQMLLINEPDIQKLYVKLFSLPSIHHYIESLDFIAKWLDFAINICPIKAHFKLIPTLFDKGYSHFPQTHLYLKTIDLPKAETIKKYIYIGVIVAVSHLNIDMLKTYPTKLIMYSIPEKLTKSVLNLIHQMTNIPNIPLKLCNLLMEYLKKTPIDLLDENLEEEEEDFNFEMINEVISKIQNLLNS